MVSYYRKAFLTFIITVLAGGPIAAQSVGNPVRNLYESEFSMGLNAETIWKDMAGSDYLSYRVLTKSCYGLYDWSTLYLLLGYGNIRIQNPPESIFGDFDGNWNLAFGGGVQFFFIQSPKVDLFISIGGLRFRSKGPLTRNEEEVFRKFEWREFWITHAFIFHLSKMDIYTGLELQTIHLRREEISTEISTNLQRESNSNFVIGIDYHLPQHFELNIQGVLGNETAILIGLSQRTIGFRK